MMKTFNTSKIIYSKIMLKYFIKETITWRVSQSKMIKLNSIIFSKQISKITGMETTIIRGTLCIKITLWWSMLTCHQRRASTSFQISDKGRVLCIMSPLPWNWICESKFLCKVWKILWTKIQLIQFTVSPLQTLASRMTLTLILDLARMEKSLETKFVWWQISSLMR